MHGRWYLGDNNQIILIPQPPKPPGFWFRFAVNCFVPTVLSVWLMVG